MIMISIADQFSKTPGHRSPDDGPDSGEEFLANILRPAYEESCVKRAQILVDLDGTAGYATSFLEAAFGGLAREQPVEDVKKTLRFKSDDEPYLIDEIAGYIRDARNK
jgi:hypothetical protein